MHLAAERGFIEIAQALLDAGADIEGDDRDGATPLYFAAYQGHFAMLCFLIACGANAQAQDRFKRTPLHFAAGGSGKLDERLRVIKKLIEKGAKVNQIGLYNSTPLDYASEQVVKDLLKKHGAQSGKNLGWCSIQ